MSQDDIELLINQFAAAAIRAKTAGLDAIEIHGGHGYIISEFYHLQTNVKMNMAAAMKIVLDCY